MKNKLDFIYNLIILLLKAQRKLAHRINAVLVSILSYFIIAMKWTCFGLYHSSDISLKLELVFCGAVAQLGERLHGMQEVGGSTPLSSTTKHG